ncbi:hypothetical protein RB195_010926 [Necator americanus]|uniref:ShKT domain-containing protein n=1 Tax=Necator americanus TaxID=51031 RepID=A0ABR1D1D5_NECAM
MRALLFTSMDPPCVYILARLPQFSEEAVVCSNILSESVCTALYGAGVVAHSNDPDRVANCYKTAARDEDLVQAAISTCPRTCGYCCLTPEYNCQNKQYPRIRCEFITRVMCNDPFWRNIIQEDCPNKCGFCNTGNCTDLIPNCAKDISICRNVDMQAFVKEYCKRTCNYCSETGSNTVSTPCGSDPNCVNWVRNGFCNSAFYTVEQKKRYCGKPCLLC